LSSIELQSRRSGAPRWISADLSASARDARPAEGAGADRGSARTRHYVIVGIEAFELQPQVKICERFGCQIQQREVADPYVAISPSMRAKPCPFFASALFQELNELAVPSKSGVKPDQSREQRVSAIHSP